VTKYRDYYSYVKTPMDFGSMKVKAEEGGYGKPAEVYGDALLVFNNARTYNQPTEDVYYMATVLQVIIKHRTRVAAQHAVCEVYVSLHKFESAGGLQQRAHVQPAQRGRVLHGHCAAGEW
jgi:hypothetical protein